MIRRVFYLMILFTFVLSGCGTELVTINDPATLQESPVQQDAPARAVSSVGGSYSGDDIYDPAVGSSELGNPRDANKVGGFLPVTSDKGQRQMAGNYSGDDPYDPAAGGLSR